MTRPHACTTCTPVTASADWRTDPTDEFIMDTTATTNRDSPDNAATLFAKVFGAVYLLIGLVGFAVTGFDGWFATDTGETLLWFELNPFHNVVHLVIGAALLAGARRPASAKAIATIVGLGYGLVGIVGLFALGEEWNILSLNQSDNWLHIGTAVIALLAVAASSDRSDRATHERATTR